MNKRTPGRKISTRDGIVYLATASLSIGGYLVYRQVVNEGQDSNLALVLFVAAGITVCVAVLALWGTHSDNQKKEHE